MLPWLYAIAAHVIANQYRSARRRHNLDLRLAHETGTGAPASDPAESLDRRDAFSTAFALLGESSWRLAARRQRAMTPASAAGAA